jgi:biotin carboxyl carrier protein
MSIELPLPMIRAEMQKPNGSVAHPAVASVSASPQPALKKKPRRLRRIFRAAAGTLGMLIVLLVFAKWVLIPVVLPMTNDAWPNAPLVVVRAENEGDAQIRLAVGQAVEQGETVAVLSNRGVDPSRLARLKAEIAITKAERTKRQSELQVAKDLEQLADRELEQYRQALLTCLRASLQQTDAQIQELTAAHERSRKLLQTSRYLGKGDAVSREDLDRDIEAEAKARYGLQQAEASRLRLVSELEAAERNVFVQRETPIYLTFHLNLRQSIPQLQAELAETEKRLAATQTELAYNEEHAHRLAGSTVCSPVSGVVWRRSASWGPVAKGEPLVEIAQTEGQFIEALFPERHAQSFFSGAKVVILFSGLRPLRGTVRAVRQPSPTDHDWASAIRLPRRLNQLEVLIDFDKPPSDASLLGRQCQVLAADPSNVAHAWAAKLFCLLRW